MSEHLRKLIPGLLASCSLYAVAATRYVDLNSSAPTPPYTNWVTAATNIQDAVDAAVEGDLVLVTNGVYQSGGRVVIGALTNRVVVDKAVSVQSVNGPSFTSIKGNPVIGDNAVRCVWLATGASLSGFTVTEGGTRGSFTLPEESWGGGIWCESASAVVSNCVLVGNRSQSTGGGAVNGVLLDSLLLGNESGGGGGLALSAAINCTIRSNVAGWGGGADSSWLSNCVVESNSALWAGGGGSESTFIRCLLRSNTVSFVENIRFGGGASWSRLDSCVVAYNRAPTGGGSFECVVNNSLIASNSAIYAGGHYAGYPPNELHPLQVRVENCTIVGNTASGDSGGVRDALGTYHNSIIFYNTAPIDPNHTGGANLHSCCTTPLPLGYQNITNAPLFLDPVAGDFRLQSNSPCINAGNNAFVTNAVDLDGNPRIAGGTVDIGAYEHPWPSSLLSYAWAQQFGLATDGSADFTDDDGDGHHNWQEWRADTIPTDALSVLRMVGVTHGASGLDVTWHSVATRRYWLERSSNLGGMPAFQTIATNVAGAVGTKTYSDNAATNGGPYFYRVGVP